MPVTKFYPQLKMRVFVDDIAALLMVKNGEVAEMAKKGDEKAERRSAEKKVSSFQSPKMASKERAR